ncbi:MAG: hypothetical protein Q9160_003722 [Pyrenula sp. 1 TL-2023]
MSTPQSSTPLTSLPPISPITLPNHSLLAPTLQHLHAHSSLSTLNHVIRSTYLSFLAIHSLPHLSAASPPLVLLSCLMHDLGWDPTKRLISPDKRFEVDGANAAVNFLRHQTTEGEAKPKESSFSESDLTLLWHVIALHTTPSLALESPCPEAAAVALGISADFFGPDTPGKWVPLEFWKRLLKAFPREGFREELKKTMCGICREKPEAARGNFVEGYAEWLMEGEGWERGESFARVLDGALGRSEGVVRGKGGGGV